MPASNLFEIDPDKLFALCSIEEIQSTQIKLQHEIERKREELRTMVGERYRDLIEAADKITEMKDISHSVIKDIESVSAAIDDLQEKSVKHNRFKNQEETYNHVNTLASSLESVAVQLKLLVELPEHIWTALDKSDYAVATQLFMLGRHIKTGLEMDTVIRANGSPSNQISNCPLLERQWVGMSQFKDCILKKVGVALQEQNIDAHSACGCFISVALLDNKCSKDLVQYFLSLRSSALKNTLESALLQSNEDPSVLKLRFLNSHIIVISTMMTLYSLFIEYPGELGDGVLWRSIRKVIGRDSTPIINIIVNNDQKKLNEFDEHRFYHLLPLVISNYRCCPESALEPLPPSKMSSIISDWLMNVTQLIKESGKAVLDRLCSLRSLQGLRDANQELPEEWNLVLQRLMQPSSLNIWNDLYIPLIVERAKELITVHWLASLKDIKQQIDMITRDVTSDNAGKTPENDLHWYIWKENANDLTFSGAQHQPAPKLHLQQLSSVRGVWLKSQGITPRIAELCYLFESHLSTLLSDLSTLYPSYASNSIIDVREDSKLLQSHQCTQCLEVLSQLLMYVKNEVDKSSGEVVPLLLARFVQSIVKLCPTLQKCLSVFDAKVNAWQEACNMIMSYTKHCWSVWQARVLLELNDTILLILLPPKELKDLLKMIPQWDIVSIEEVGEAGQPFSSDLRIPSSPSFQLLSLLSSVCSTISNALVPTYVTEMLVNELVVKILEVYQNMVSVETQVANCPSKLWQLLFDIKYITALLVQHDNKPLLSKCQEVTAQVEICIDPFDLDVFNPFIMNNIRRSHRQTQSLLGVLLVSRIPSSINSSSLTTNTNMQAQFHSEDPSVLAISTSASSTWFSLLPITAPPGTRAINPVKVKALKVGVTTEQPSQDSQHTITSKATAALTTSSTSFFGSMTSDWFG